MAARQARALVVQPAAELRRGIGNVEPLEQRTSVELEGLGGLSGVERRLKRNRVAPDHLLVDTQFLVGATDYRFGAERAPEEMDRLAESVAGARLVLLRPEEGEQLVTAVQASWGCEGEVNEERNASGLGKERAKLVSFRTLELQRAKRP